MSESDVKDRRAYERHNAEIQLSGTADEGGVMARMVTHNLSMGGLHCTSTCDFPEMTRLAVRLVLPTRNGSKDGAPVDVEAVVVRRQEVGSSAGPSRFELSLFFTRVQPTGRDLLAKYLGLN